MIPKDFDCVEFQHKAGAALTRKLRAMTPEERTAYFEKGNRELREKQAKLRARAKSKTA